MRSASKLLLLLGLASCAGQSASRFQDVALPRAVSVGTALDEARWRARPVDTIVVHRARLDLRQGEIVNLARELSAGARDADGATIPGFLPVFLIEGNGDAVQLTERGLEAIAPGSATILVLPLAAPQGRSVVTRIPVTVGAKPLELSQRVTPDSVELTVRTDQPRQVVLLRRAPDGAVSLLAGPNASASVMVARPPAVLPPLLTAGARAPAPSAEVAIGPPVSRDYLEVIAVDLGSAVPPAALIDAVRGLGTGGSAAALAARLRSRLHLPADHAPWAAARIPPRRS